MAIQSLRAREEGFYQQFTALKERLDGLKHSEAAVSPLVGKVRQSHARVQALASIGQTIEAWKSKKTALVEDGGEAAFSAESITGAVKQAVRAETIWYNKKVVGLSRLGVTLVVGGLISGVVMYFVYLIVAFSKMNGDPALFRELHPARFQQMRTINFKVIPGIALATMVLGGLALLGSFLLENSELPRKDRLYNDADFADFLTHKVKGKYSQLDLLDPELHQIYLQYKSVVTQLPAQLA